MKKDWKSERVQGEKSENRSVRRSPCSVSTEKASRAFSSCTKKKKQTACGEVAACWACLCRPRRHLSPSAGEALSGPVAGHVHTWPEGSPDHPRRVPEDRGCETLGDPHQAGAVHLHDLVVDFDPGRPTNQSSVNLFDDSETARVNNNQRAGGRRTKQLILSH